MGKVQISVLIEPKNLANFLAGNPTECHTTHPPEYNNQSWSTLVTVDADDVDIVVMNVFTLTLTLKKKPEQK